MTRLLVIPDENTQVQVDVPLNSAELVLAINAGSWMPPEPYAGLLRSMGSLRAVALGGGVVAVCRADPAALSEAAAAERLGISQRELEVLQCMAEGLSNKEIARRLGIAVRTVAYHLRAIRARFGWGNRLQSVSRAAELGLVRMNRKPE